MFYGAILAVSAGLLSTVTGIVMSRLAKSGTGIIEYYLINAGATVAICAFAVLSRQDFSCGELLSQGWLFLYVCGGGILSAFGTLIMQSAMRRGHNGIIWGICQSALIFPFLAGVIVFGQEASIVRFGGLALILGGMFIPLLRAGRGTSCESGCTGISWVPMSLTAFAVLGFSLILWSMPSYWSGWSDRLSLRPLFAYAGLSGGFILWALCGSLSSLRFRRRTVCVAVGMAFVNFLAFKAIFLALDVLSCYGAASIVYPVCIGTCIVAFSLYSFLILKERTAVLNWLGTAGIAGGIILISLKG